MKGYKTNSNGNMIAYKAFNKGADGKLTCRDVVFEEGEEYKLEGEAKICSNGFHFCRDLVLTLIYYPCDKITDNAYAEVEILGETDFEKPTEHKGCTTHM